MTETIDAVVAGHLCLDVIPDLSNIDPDEFQTLFQPGRLLEIGAVSYATGGAVSNTGLALHRLGANTRLMGKIGDDLFGDAVRQYIATFDPKLTAGTVVDKNANTSYTIIINPPQMDRIFLHDPGANDHFYADDIRIDLVADSRLFHFGYPPLMKSMFENEGVVLAEIFERAKRTGVTTSLDLSLPDVSAASGQAPWPAILHKTLPNVDVFLPSIEEILFMLRREMYDQLRGEAGSVDFLPLITPAILQDISAELHAFGIAIVGIKLGYRGLYLHTADAATIAGMGRAAPSDPARWANLEFWTPPFQVDVVGTTGAGDATIAGFLAALLRDMTPEEAVNMATAVGACNVEAADGLSGIRAWGETEARVQTGWAKHSESLDDFGWQYQAKTQLWKPLSVDKTGNKTFVGFGFGAIQAGLFLYEAFKSGNFGRLVVAEVLPDRVAEVRRNDGRFAVNIAHEDCIERAQVGPIEIYDPTVAEDREQLIQAIADAEEIATAIPSVVFYITDGPGSLHRILAGGLRRKAVQDGPLAVVYAAENNNHAAEILEEAVFAEIPVGEQEGVRARVCFLNTVVGKMSGVKTDAAEIEAQDLRLFTPDSDSAFLVEAFNHILISKIQFEPDLDSEPYRRGIEVFEEKEDLLPFEEAKLYGHNAIHALAAYLGAVQGYELIADLRSDPDIMAFLRAAFIEESGAALIRKYTGVDALFSPQGYAEYADDLLLRMTNPHLRDSIERVGRDPERKLGWDDRLVGTMRLALKQGVEPERFAQGVAAALSQLESLESATETEIQVYLLALWQKAKPGEEETEAIFQRILPAWYRFQQ